MKVTIDEISLFIKEGWPQPEADWFMDDVSDAFDQHLNEKDYSPKTPGEKVELDDFTAWLGYQGKDPELQEKYSNDGLSFTRLFEAWRKKRTCETFAVEVPKAKAKAVRAAIKAAGGKVL